ncbi:MAG: type III pantothenate kinase, partial [Limnohabitans sp.]
QHVRQHTHNEPLCYMTGGAGWKMAPNMSVKFELVESLIFDGLRQIASQRLAT